MSDDQTRPHVFGVPEVLEAPGGASVSPRGARTLSYLAVAVLSATLGWYAGSSSGAPPAIPVSSRLDLAQSDVVLTDSGDLRVQMTVINYGDLSYRVKTVRINKLVAAIEPTVIRPSASVAIELPVNCDTVNKRRAGVQIAVEFVSDRGVSSEFGFLTPPAMHRACVRLAG